MLKTLLFAAACYLPLGVAAQAGYTLKGKIGSVNAPATIYLYDTQKAGAIDSAVLRKGKFTFKGKLQAPISAYLMLNYEPQHGERSRKTEHLYFHLENSKINIKSPDSLRRATIKGSQSNDDDRRLKAMQRPYKRAADSLMAVYRTLTAEQRKDPAFQESASRVMKWTQAGYDSVSRVFITQNPDSYIALAAFREVELAYNFDPDSAEARFARLSPRVRQSVTGQQLAEIIRTGKMTNVGAMAADFQQPDTAGNPVKLSDYRGKYVLLEFWASWCAPCRAENPVLLAAYNKYKEKGFSILGVSLDDERGRNAWLGAIKQDGLPWTQVSELQGFKSEAAVLYGVSAIPANFLVDPSGKIVARNLRGEQLEEALGKLLGSE